MTEALSLPIHRNEAPKPLRLGTSVTPDWKPYHKGLSDDARSRANTLAECQTCERQDTEKRYQEKRADIHAETGAKVSVERMITEVQTMLYAALGIDPKLERNSTIGKCAK